MITLGFTRVQDKQDILQIELKRWSSGNNDFHSLQEANPPLASPCVFLYRICLLITELVIKKKTDNDFNYKYWYAGNRACLKTK